MIPKKDNQYVRPKCDTGNGPVDDVWLNMMNDKEQNNCINCNEPLYNAKDSDSDKSTKNGFFIRFLLIATCLFGVLFFLNSYFHVLSMDKDFGNIAYTTILLLFISSTLAHGKFLQKFKHLSFWAGILILLMIGYSYRYELTGIKNKVMAELIPMKGIQNSLESISFPVSSDGHFYIRAFVNEIPIVFLVDTGASDIVLSPRDAEKLGFNIAELNFNRFYETANGMVRGSLIQLSDFNVGNIHLTEIGASVNESEMRNSLLGMAFFNRLKNFQIKNEMLTLFWNP